MNFLYHIQILRHISTLQAQEISLCIEHMGIPSLYILGPPVEPHPQLPLLNGEVLSLLSKILCLLFTWNFPVQA